MSNLNFYEILIYIIPQIILLTLVYLFLIQWQRKMSMEATMQSREISRKNILPHQIQAYERMVLFLERIDLPQMLGRLNYSKSTATELQGAMVNEINTEYEHNYSQQLFMTNQSWNAIKITKEKAIQSILLAYQGLPQDASAKDLALKIMSSNIQNQSPSDIESTIQLLKSDFRKIVG